MIRMHAKRSPSPEHPVVYFISYGTTKWVKIGFATNLKKRLCQLQVSSPENLTVEASVAGSQPQEKRLHYALSGHQGNGEWFKPSALVKLVTEMAANGTSIEELIDFAKNAGRLLTDDQLNRVRHKLQYARWLKDETLPELWQRRYRQWLREIEIEERVAKEMAAEEMAA